MSWKRKLAFSLFTFGLVCASVLVGAEVLLRLFSHAPLYIADPVQGSILRPNIRSRYARADVDQEIVTNRWGFHDEDYPQEKPAGHRRVVVLGDSYMEALQVGIPETFTKQLQGLLSTPARRVQAINTGRSGRGCLEDWLCLRTLGFGFQPDLVVLSFVMNDVDDDWARRNLIARDERGRPTTFVAQGISPLPLWLKAVVHRSWAMYRVLEAASIFWTNLKRGRAGANAAAAAQAPVDDSFRILRTRYDAETEKAWTHTLEVLAGLDAECRERNVRFMLMVVPAENQFDARKSPTAEYWKLEGNLTDRPQQILREFCAKRGIPILDLLEPFRASPIRPLHADEGHWNAAGNRLAAELASKYIDEQGLLK